MVLDAGYIVSRLMDLPLWHQLTLLQKAEFDSPAELLRNEKGKLRALVNESKDMDVLLAMVASQAFDA